MAVYKDEQRGTWYLQTSYKDLNGKRVQLKRRGFKRKKDAQIAENDLIEEYKNPYIDLTFERLAQLYMDYSIGHKKKRSIENQNSLINTVLIPHFKNYKVKDIKPNDIDTFYRKMLPQYSNATMKNIRIKLSAILNYGVSFYDLPKSPASIVSLPKKQEKRHLKYWTVEQFNTFISYVDDILYKSMFSVLFWTGLRKGEMLALRVCDIDFDNKTIYVENSWNGTDITSVKTTASERRIGIPDHLCNKLSELINYRKFCYGSVKQSAFLFSVRNPTVPMSPTNVNMQLKKITAKSELPRIRVHYFSHSHASLLINNGVSLYVVSRHLGHKSIQITANIYGHLYPSSEAVITNVLDNIYKTDKGEVILS